MEGPPTLEVLTLDNTDLNDDAMPFIAACTSLRTLSLTSTKVTGMYPPLNQGTHNANGVVTLEGNALFPVIDALPKLSYLNVTGCRGIDVAHRKRFFEVCTDQTEIKPHGSTLSLGLRRVERTQRSVRLNQARRNLETLVYDLRFMRCLLSTERVVVTLPS